MRKRNDTSLSPQEDTGDLQPVGVLVKNRKQQLVVILKMNDHFLFDDLTREDRDTFLECLIVPEIF